MRTGLVAIGLFVGIFSSTACQNRETKPQSVSWPENMQKLSQAIQDLIPYLYNRTEYSEPENAKVIKSNLTKLENSVHRLSDKKLDNMPDVDPAIRYVANMFERDIQRAVNNFANGNKELSRTQAKSVLNHCFFCHTRSQYGPQLPDMKNALERVEWIDPLEKADLLVALRDYKSALDVLRRHLIQASDLPMAIFDKERALAKYLAIAVRVKKDPEVAMEALDLVLEQPKVSDYLQHEVNDWMESVQRWKREQARTKDIPPSKYLSEAKRLLQTAGRIQEFPRDKSSYVELLRASAYLHGLLRDPGLSQQYAEAMLLLGQTYEVITDLGYWFLHENYYEACIHEAPHTATAKKCYDRYRQSVYLGYTGSAGTFIPAQVLDHLKELQALAKPEKATH